MSYRPPAQPPRNSAAQVGFWMWMLAPAAVVILSLIVKGCST